MAWYLVCGLAGLVVGLILGVLIDRDTVNKYYNKIRKVKVKGDDNVVTDLISKKEFREQRKKEKKAYREAKKGSPDG